MAIKMMYLEVSVGQQDHIFSFCTLFGVVELGAVDGAVSGRVILFPPWPSPTPAPSRLPVCTTASVLDRSQGSVALFIMSLPLSWL